MNQKERDRLTIRQQIERFLSGGGRITAVPAGASGEDFVPKRTRADQVEWCRKRNRITRTRHSP